MATVAGPPDVQELLFLRHDNPAQDTPGLLTWTPDIEVGDADDAWHPEDALFAPLWAVDGTLVGVLSVDLPVHGRRPGPRQRELLAQFARQAALAIALLDSDGAVARFNPAYGELLGDRGCDLGGRRQDQWIHEDDRVAYEDALTEARSGQVPPPMELRFLVLADRILAGIAEPIDIDGVRLTTTGSIGVATSAPDIPSTPDELLSRADHALYQAKRGGRNRWLAAPGG